MTPDLVVSIISAFLSAIQVLQAQRAYHADKRSNEYRDYVESFRRTYRDQREMLRSHPSVIREANQLLSLLPPDTINRFGDRIDKCIEAFDSAIDPSSSKTLRDAEKELSACICSNLKALKRTNKSVPPGRLRELWEQYDCGPITW